MSTALELLNKIKAIFNTPVVAPVAQAAPAPAAAAPKVYKLQDGREVSIAQAGETPGAGDIVTIDGVPAPEGALTLEDGTQITVGPSGAITQADALPVTNDLSLAPTVLPVPTLEERISALENKAIAPAPAPVAVAAAANDGEAVKAISVELTAAQSVIARHEETIKGLFELVEVLVKMPSTDPKTLTGTKKEQFEKSHKVETRLNAMSDAVASLRKKA